MFDNLLRNNEGAVGVAENNRRHHAPQEKKHPEPASKQGHQADKQQANILEKIRNFRVEFGPGRKDILNFTNQLAVMIRAGISIQDALEAIGEQNENQKFRKIILDLKRQIEAGQSFSQ